MRTDRSPLRQAVLELFQRTARSLHPRSIAADLEVEQEDYPGLLETLSDLAASGAIVKEKGDRFRMRTQGSDGREREGILSVNPRGFGFVSGGASAEDLYIPEDRMAGAMHGDVVKARVVSRSARGAEGEIVKIVSRANHRVAGVLRRRGKSAWLEPDDARMRGPIVLGGSEPGHRAGEDGEAAVARITRFPEMPRETPEGVLEAVLGMPGDPNVEVAKILLREAIEEPHPEDATREAEAFGVEVSPAALAGREDLTGIPLPTIDPEDARDHDDAVWCARQGDGSYRAWVAIADVSSYVRPGTALDREALARGCSIYLPDRAIPMLPRALSSNLCSLLPGVIRLCLCVEAVIDATGATQSYRVFEGYMRSAAKLTYGQVARALNFTDKPAPNPAAEAMREDLAVLNDLAGVLRAQRLRRGALDFDLPEAKLVLDKETGAPISIEKRTEDPGVKKAYQLIEELMLLANELVARFLTERQVPAIYRVHGAPDEQKLDKFATMATTLGLPFDLEDAKDPKKLSALLKRVAKHPSRDVFNMLLLRAMKQATYDTNNIGHFGLASTAYLHFTSPIRRYPDLVVHRAVRQVLAKGGTDRSPSAVETLQSSAVTASERERHAMDVEREVVDLYRALYMRGHIGEVFTGKVTAVVGSGVYVQLESPFVDVMVKAEALGEDRYELDDDGMRMVGMRSGDAVALGDAMDVTIDDVAILRRTVYGRRLGVTKKDADERVAQRGNRGGSGGRGGGGAGAGGGRGGASGGKGKRGLLRTHGRPATSSASEKGGSRDKHGKSEKQGKKTAPGKKTETAPKKTQKKRKRR
jgi:ribonuclease R